MDKEDAEAMVKETSGESAYNVDDKSESQKALNEILKKINAKTTDAKQTQSLAALNIATMDSPGGDMFDSVDSMMGAATTVKEGEALYRAALPTCVEMAKEVCDPADIKIIQSTYQMAIEQDCNTLAKNYESLKSTAAGKAKEASALLDMSRLTNHQDRNSADMLACTKQMMEAMGTDSVCGSDLGKCLDWSGKYIDPMTGSAILTEDLANLTTVLTKPSGDEKWISLPMNAGMVKFLEGKKTYIETATKNCEMIQTAVWDNFMEGALAKIKIAQNNKLESMRRSCTPIIAKCKSDTAQTLQNFDSRALSIFGVAADTTVNKMCSDIQVACGALMRMSLDNPAAGGAGAADQAGEGWAKGMEEVDLQKTYKTILQNCKLVGQECVKLQCQTNENQFGLCLEQKAPQRRVILYTSLKDNVCYKEVESCVGQIGDMKILDTIVSNNQSDFLDPGGDRYLITGSSRSNKTKISENIWGRCASPNLVDPANKILLTDEHEASVLAWFGKSVSDNCFTGLCEDGSSYVYEIRSSSTSSAEGCAADGSPISSGYEVCNLGAEISDNGGIANGNENSIVLINTASSTVNSKMFYVKGGKTYFTNCCYSREKDGFGNCCEYEAGSIQSNLMNTQNIYQSGIGFTMPSTALPSAGGLCDPTRQCCFEDSQRSQNADANYKYCVPKVNAVLQYIASAGKKHLFCMGSMTGVAGGGKTPGLGVSDSNAGETCAGTFLMVDGETGIYRTHLGNSATAIERYLNYFYDNINTISGGVDEQHRLKVYMPVGNYSIEGGSDLRISGENYYYFATDTNGVNHSSSGVNGSHRGPHRIAYCEHGFKINIKSQTFSCCNSSDNCLKYVISPDN